MCCLYLAKATFQVVVMNDIPKWQYENQYIYDFDYKWEWTRDNREKYLRREKERKRNKHSKMNKSLLRMKCARERERDATEVAKRDERQTTNGRVDEKRRMKMSILHTYRIRIRMNWNNFWSLEIVCDTVKRGNKKKVIQTEWQTATYISDLVEGQKCDFTIYKTKSHDSCSPLKWRNITLNRQSWRAYAHGTQPCRNTTHTHSSTFSIDKMSWVNSKMTKNNIALHQQNFTWKIEFERTFFVYFFYIVKLFWIKWIDE